MHQKIHILQNKKKQFLGQEFKIGIQHAQKNLIQCLVPRQLLVKISRKFIDTGLTGMLFLIIFLTDDE